MSVSEFEQAPSWQQVWNIVRNGPLWGLWAVLALEILGASLVIPIFAFFCIHELKLEASAVGIVMASFNLAQCLGGPLFGKVSDAFGRRAILLLCFAWSALCFLATSLVGGFLDLLVVRTLAGLSGGSIPVATAMLIDCTTSTTRPKILGAQGCIHGATFSLGMVLVLVLLWLEVARRQIFVLAGVFCFLGLLLGMFILQESLPPERRRPLFSNAGAGWAELFDDWRLVRMPLVCVWVARFLYAFSVFCLYTTYAFLIRDNFDWSDREFAMILTCAGLTACVLEITFYPAASAGLGEHWCVVLGCLLVAAGVVVLPTKSVLLHLCGMLTFEVGQSLCEPGLVSLTALHAPSEKHMGFTQGVSNSFRAMASFVGPPLAGFLYERSQVQAYGLSASVAVASASVIVCIIVMLPSSTAAEKERLLDKNQIGQKTQAQSA